MEYAVLIIVLYTIKVILSLDCPTGCTSCTSPETCTACEDVYYLRKQLCYYRCPLQCANCNYGECTVCRDGFYGKLCERQCDPKCLDGLCDKDTGVCSNGEKDMTDDVCPANCKTCDSYNNCVACKEGLWGGDCGTKCGGDCLLNTCDKTTGWCVPIYVTITANAPVSDPSVHVPCAAGKFGERCDSTCPEACIQSFCFRDNGTCVNGCMDGYFGERCNWRCPAECEHGCHMRDGTCLDACSNGKDSDGCKQDLATSDNINGDDGSDKIIIGVAVGSCGVAILTIVVVVILVLRMRLSRARASGQQND